MEQYIIKGGKPLRGEVTISGYKNAALGILAAAIMTEETVKIDNVPNISDIQILLKVIEDLGVKVDRIGKHTVKINASKINTVTADTDSVRKIRGSYYLVGALLGRFNKAQIALPGGCNIGSRPIDRHIKGFEALGSEVKIEHGLICASAQKLVGTSIYFDESSVGATINVMLAAIMAEGQTTIENAAKEPHVVDVANFLNSMGANIKGAGTDVIRIKGVSKLHGSEYTIIPDQIEAGTFMFAAAASRGDVLIKNVIPKHLEAFTAKLLEVGVKVEEYDDAVRVTYDKRPGSTHVKTLVYPGFLTDMQPLMTTLLSLSTGTSIVTESIFENRFKFVDELTKMGASIKVVESNTAIITGVERLTGAIVSAADLRGGAALVLAGIMAEGYTIVENVEFIERGYEDFERKMQELGATMAKVDSNDTKAIRKFKLKVS